ncbi:PARP-domain-containing protein [Pholiota conissans]|uniref:Poly [ADP-ribose] polymerase n=1 Tax=Pholiota conissans TaxID=109636 RepID=A0A9P5ZCN1_9AGAR|nr:PARP-domain-containing protein [Pholiota conissans]
MPPRKKTAAAATDGDAPDAVAPRSSSRIKAAAASAQSVQQPAPPAAPAPAKKPAAKRGRAATTSDDPPTRKPASKKAKKAKADEDEEAMDDAEDDDAPAPAPAAVVTAAPIDQPKKMVTVIKRGAAPVDPNSGYVITHQVYSDGGEVWDAMLNQTDISGNSNKNKFYVIQLLHPIGSNSNCILFTRWGRVGDHGQTQTKGPFPSSAAINEFKKQFKSKTATAWEDRRGMTAKKGKYMWLERDYDDAEEETDKHETRGEGIRSAPTPDSKLAAEIQELCRLIFSTSIIDAHLSSMNYDARKLPLGKLAKSTILNGFAALKTLAEVIQDPTGDRAKEYGGARRACEDLSSSYYSIIPHDFGRQRPVVIDNAEFLKRELELVDALGDMEVASKLISSTVFADENGNPVNPIDAHFRSLGLSKMEPIHQSSQEFQSLVAYARDTHGATHRNIHVNIRQAFRVERDSETHAWNAKGHSQLPNGERLLLWHGSRTTNFAGILKQGLRIAPPEAPVSGYMFGKGVYFADMMSKSANYCYSHLSGGTGLLLLCEVAAKPFHELIDSDYNADVACKKNNKLATKGIGRTQPLDWKDAGRALDHPELIGCDVPAGPGKDVAHLHPGVYLQYNEYIVYDPSQIRLRYLLMVDM